ncbi:MAG: hypothetical protein ACD_45C00583G0002 [uncultured bacterium]|nr:MAG: hypothetical protein ACD_45C00583G0002 [uncultured bacterium]OGT55189.1 MAG: hypothetical protein A3F43_01865 [Gammaproteobacteria bacterium RIFCSPHIGHO2_12_FULL_42_10]
MFVELVWVLFKQLKLQMICYGCYNPAMKKFILSFLLLMTSTIAIAGGQIDLSLKITDPIKANRYFICLYGIGCLSLHATESHRVFSMAPIDMNNIKKIVIADLADKRLYFQPIDPSCQVDLHANQKITVAGELSVKNNVPVIEKLHCLVA